MPTDTQGYRRAAGRAPTERDQTPAERQLNANERENKRALAAPSDREYGARRMVQRLLHGAVAERSPSAFLPFRLPRRPHAPTPPTMKRFQVTHRETSIPRGGLARARTGKATEFL